ncbi:MAG TPA: hypothetical protein VKA26_13280 [Ignavibacteriaceae bacterium]|nr:hypothetical protein [Ignavibacteriaceae bacterium]
MNNNISKIESLLAKDKLSAEDNELIKKIVSNDAEAKDFYEKYLRIGDFVKNSSHLSEEEIGNYLLFKGKNSGQIKLNGAEVNKIEKHIKECDKCSKIYLELDEELKDISTFVTEKFEGSDSSLSNQIQLPTRNKLIRYYLVPIISIAVIYAILFVTSIFVTPKTTKLAGIDENTVNYVTRGRASNEFQKGLAALDSKDYPDAVNYFISDAENNPDDETIFYSHYVLGLTYLEMSERDFVGLFPSFDKGNVTSAIESFNKCINKNNSGSYPDITASSFFFIGEAELMLGNNKAAIENFRKVIDLKGSKIDKAKKLLMELE